MRLWIPVTICIILTLFFPVLADIKTVPPGGTVFIGEENLDISGSGVSSGSQIAWWAPGTSLDEAPADTVTVSNPARFSALSATFLGKEGIWYTLTTKTPVMKIKQPKLKVKIKDTTSDFDATGKWLPRGHLASFQIESNLYEIRSRGGISGAPVDILITTPSRSEYSTVSGPSGSFRLNGIPVSSSLYDTGPVWNTGGTDSGTYTIQAKCTANELDSNSADPGTGVSEPITVLIQDINPLSNSGRQVGIETGSSSTDTGEKITQVPTIKATPAQTMTTGAAVTVSQNNMATSSPRGTSIVTTQQTEVPVPASSIQQPVANQSPLPVPPTITQASQVPTDTPVPALPVPVQTKSVPLSVPGVILTVFAAMAALCRAGKR
ncbi:DUF3821 domain-containing protein [Methanospirillum lacunae]|uniref:DUF3821 domain-containing protein n=1 Tax=Methanospirillum lacunae TaxID=668570 RepID=A0A2V2N7S0_9EURY|nr:DUF3821 domain-containing protein [Methanospirillum lacunae]PWR71611.1 hypothetical protein DK846_12210 [Methanospirillum lacunae]